MNKFEIGDTVKVIEEKRDEQLIGMIGKISGYSNSNNPEVDFGIKIYQLFNKINDTTHTFYESELVLEKKNKNIKEKPDTHVRYMTYGTDCENKGTIVKTEKELKEKMKEVNNDWNGRIIGYKLTPILEAKTNTRISSFKKSKKWFRR